MAEKLFVEVRGRGTPLTLLHGYPLNHTIWEDVEAQLDDEFRVIMPDLRGQGRSPSPAGVYRMRVMAEDILRLLDDLGVKKTVMAGHSMGGYVALTLAKHHPERLLGLALVASHAYADTPEKKQSRLDAIEQIKRSGVVAVLAAMPEKLSRNTAVIERCRSFIPQANAQGIIGTLAGLAEREDMIDVFTHLDMPALIIAGVDDQINPIAMNRDMAAKMKKTRLVEVENAGHMPMLENPEQTAHALRVFIRSIKENS